jgi:hypothetical protein
MQRGPRRNQVGLHSSFRILSVGIVPPLLPATMHFLSSLKAFQLTGTSRGFLAAAHILASCLRLPVTLHWHGLTSSPSTCQSRQYRFSALERRIRQSPGNLVGGAVQLTRQARHAPVGSGPLSRVNSLKLVTVLRQHLKPALPPVGSWKYILTPQSSPSYGAHTVCRTRYRNLDDTGPNFRRRSERQG